MRSEAGQKKIAKAIYDAIAAFKTNYDHSLSNGKGNGKASSPDAKPTDGKDGEGTAALGDICYGTQVLASGKKMASGDPFFKGYTPTEVISGKYFKYVIGVSADLSAAREKHQSLKKIFPGSFLVKVENRETTVVR